MAEKQGYSHFMLKEIHEQPFRLKNTLRLQDSYLELMTTFLDRAGEVFLVACGTSYHACLAASYLFLNLKDISLVPVNNSTPSSSAKDASHLSHFFLSIE